MKPPPTQLRGLGVAAPRGTRDQQTAAGFALARCRGNAREQAWLLRIYRQSGVNRRGSVLLEPEAGGDAALERFYPLPVSNQDRGPSTAARLRRYARAAGPLAAEACRGAFTEAGDDPADMTHLITVSCTGLMSPGLDAQLIRCLGLSPDVGRINLGFMGCHGALNGLRAAAAFAGSMPGARVLLCCVELCSLHFQYGLDPQKIIANALFADGAGAVILGNGQQTGTRGSGSAHQARGGPDHGNDCRLLDTASRLTSPGAGEAMSWLVGDHGFEMSLSREVPALINATIGPWLEEWLSRHGLSVADVAHWIIHPGGPRIIRTVTETLALPADAGRESAAVLAEHGNMSSPTVLFILHRLRAQGLDGPCVMLGFGPGLALEAALLG